MGSKCNHKVLPYKRGRGKFGTDRERGETHTQRRRQSEDEGGDWSDAVMRQGMLKGPPETGKVKERFSPGAWGRSAILMTPEYQPNDTGLGLLASRTIRE